MSVPRILDLFCGAGGAAVGYHRAGFEVVGVDHVAQPHYPFAFVQADALGGMFGLGVHRPRLFESNVLLLAPRMPPTKEPVGVYGTVPDSRRLWSRTRPQLSGARKGRSILIAAGSLEEAQEAMGMDWGDWHGVKEAIPPAYTEFIGRQLIGALESAA